MLSGWCAAAHGCLYVHHFGQFHHFITSLALELIDDYIPNVTWPKSQASVMIDVQTICSDHINNISQIGIRPEF